MKEVSPISNKNKAETSWRGASSEVPSVSLFSCTECQWSAACSTVDSDNVNISNHLDNVFVESDKDLLSSEGTSTDVDCVKTSASQSLSVVWTAMTKMTKTKNVKYYHTSLFLINNRLGIS